MDLEEIKANMKKLVAAFETLPTRLTDNEKENRQDLLLQFPIQTRENFDALNETIGKEKVVRLQLLNKLKQIERGKHPLKSTAIGLCIVDEPRSRQTKKNLK